MMTAMMKEMMIRSKMPFLMMLPTKSEGSPEAAGTVPAGGVMVPIWASSIISVYQ